MKNIYNDSRLFALLDKYSEKTDFMLGTVLKDVVAHMDNAEMVVPVLGMQGMGKSTLINSILGENILPNDADETTCVPVEVKYGEDQSATVFFRNGKSPVKAYSREDLNFYVDNNENPANTKQVSHIVLYRKHDLLKSGLTIVDLPGVGSLTKENEETTKRYIQNLCTAIFVIPTVPTIRTVEASFIKLVWSQFSKALFVQNVWGESKREIEESVDYNSKRLKQIAGSINNTEYNGEIIVLNAYDALVGALEHDEKMIASSNINDLINSIKSISENWVDDLSNSVAARCIGFIQAAKKELLRRKAQVQMEEAEYKAALMKEYEIFKEGSARLNKLISSVDNYLMTQEIETASFIKENAKKCAGKLRSDMYKLIENNLFDGDELTKAFNDNQEECCSDFTNACFDKFMEIRFELETYMEQLQNVIEEDNNLRIETIPIYRDKVFKIEKSFMPIGSALGGLGGALLFSGVSEGVTALLAGVGAAAGPIGIAAGVLTGVIITALGGWLGGKAAEGVRSSRASEAKRAIDPKIDELEKLMKKSVTEGFEQMCSQVRSQIKVISEERNQEEKNLLNKTQNDHTDVGFDLAELEKDYHELSEKEAEIKNVC